MRALPTCTPPGAEGGNTQTPTREAPTLLPPTDRQTSESVDCAVCGKGKGVDHRLGDDLLLDARAPAIAGSHKLDAGRTQKTKVTLGRRPRLPNALS
eukprot:5042719-Alexandrium_andersonii.AAC.1